MMPASHSGGSTPIVLVSRRKKMKVEERWALAVPLTSESPQSSESQWWQTETFSNCRSSTPEFHYGLNVRDVLK